MPWWVWIWVGLMAAVTVGGAVMDSKDREPVWYIGIGIASGAACQVFVFSYFGWLPLGNLLWPAAVTLFALICESWWDVQTANDLSTAEKFGVFVVTLGLFAPATVLGALAE